MSTPAGYPSLQKCDSCEYPTAAPVATNGKHYCRECFEMGRHWVDIEPDAVNHPPHYTSHPSGIECIEITRHMGFNLGNAIKYLWRADLKGDAIEDLEKAAWYITDEITKRKASQ
jgi:Protein of unknwon function (DUF3310)